MQTRKKVGLIRHESLFLTVLKLWFHDRRDFEQDSVPEPRERGCVRVRARNRQRWYGLCLDLIDN